MKTKFVLFILFALTVFNVTYAKPEKINYLSSLIDDGLYEQALIGIRTHPMQDESDVIQLWYLTVKLYCALGNPQKAEKFLQGALPHINRPSIYFKLAKINIDITRGRLSLVNANISFLERTLSRDSNEYQELIFLKSKSQLAIGNYDEAKLIVGKLANSQVGQLEVARILMNMGSFSEAEIVLQKLINAKNVSGRVLCLCL